MVIYINDKTYGLDNLNITNFIEISGKETSVNIPTEINLTQIAGNSVRVNQARYIWNALLTSGRRKIVLLCE